jgi:hypothetical protein
MTHIQKAISNNPINNGRTVIKTSCSGTKSYDTSKDTDPTIESIQALYNGRFDDATQLLFLEQGAGASSQDYSSILVSPNYNNNYSGLFNYANRLNNRNRYTYFNSNAVEIYFQNDLWGFYDNNTLIFFSNQDKSFPWEVDSWTKTSVGSGLMSPGSITISRYIPPTPTPTVTPSITPTISITPSVTPTISITPSVTSTVTPTITPTPSQTPNNNPAAYFAAICPNSSVVSKSSNGNTWNNISLPLSSNWTSIEYGNNIFLACAALNPSGIKSNNLVSWDSVFLGNDLNFSKLFYGNNNFIGLAFNSTTAIKYDSITNTSSNSNLPARSSWTCGAYGNGLYMAIPNDSSVVAVSSDGITWTQRSLPISRDWQDLAYLNDKFFLIAHNHPFVLSSSDGITWNSYSIQIGALWKAMAYGNNKYAAVSNGSSYIALSSDGINWTTGFYNPSYDSKKIIFGNGLFVILTDGSTIMVSEDGITWTQRTISNCAWSDIAYGTLS